MMELLLILASAFLGYILHRLDKMEVEIAELRFFVQVPPERESEGAFGCPCPATGKPCSTNGRLGGIPFYYYPYDCPHYEFCLEIEADRTETDRYLGDQ